MPDALRVHIVFAEPDQVWQATVTVAPGTTLLQALKTSHFFTEFPEQAGQPVRLGVWGRECNPDQPVADDDRIEIYRPLVFDPLESRRRRAAHRKSAMNQPAARMRRRKLSCV